MRRLVDKGEDAAGMERLAELVSAAEPFRPNPFTKRRMLVQLKRKSSGKRTLAKAWVYPVGWMFVAGTAIAGVGWWHGRTHHDRPVETAAPNPPAAHGEPSAAALAAPPLVTQPSLPPEVTSSEIAARESPRPSAKSHPAKRRGATVREVTAPPASDDPSSLPRSAEDGEDPTPVVRAIRALRSERNPAQAEQLLQQYLRTHPNGALAEDALALLIETASALRSTSAADRATRYLELYPNGRYRATAKRVLSASP